MKEATHREAGLMSARDKRKLDKNHKASEHLYRNAVSGLEAEDTQDAIDELESTNAKLDGSNQPFTGPVKAPSFEGDFFQFDITYADGVAEGRLQWNSEDGTLEVGMPGGDVNLQIGQEALVKCVNKTGVTIPDGSVVYISGAQGQRPTIALAQANIEATSHVLGFTTEEFLDNDSGYVTLYGKVRELNTVGITEGDEVYLSATTPGAFTDTAPTGLEEWVVSVGHITRTHASEGEILSHIDTARAPRSANTILYTPTNGADWLDPDPTTTAEALDASASRIQEHGSFFNGTFVESFDALVESLDGITVTMSLEQAGGGDLTAQFSSGQVVIDCTPAATINLTPGADNAQTPNYIYIPESTGLLTKSTTSWPADEHVRVGYFLCPSATAVQSRGGTDANQNWNDHRAGTNGQGHLAHMGERIRRDGLGARFFSGLAGAGTSDYLTIAGTTVDLKIASGIVTQMHPHTVPAFDTSSGDTALVKNWNGDANHAITNLYDIVADSLGNTIGNNRYFTIVVWGVANKTGTYHPVFINLPSGTYLTQSAAENDLDGFNDTTIPREYLIDSSTGYLICKLVVQKKTATWEYMSTEDLRGKLPGTTAGGGASGALTEFPDNQFRVYDVAQSDSGVVLNASGIDPATDRTLTVPNADGTIALRQRPIELVAASMGATVLQETFIVDTTSGAVDITMPTEAACSGMRFTMRLDVDGGTDARFLNDAAGVIATLVDAGDLVTIQSDGTNWFIVA